MLQRVAGSAGPAAAGTAAAACILLLTPAPTSMCLQGNADSAVDILWKRKQAEIGQ